MRVGELRSRTLNLSVWHAEPLGRNMFLGEVEVSLGLWDWSYTQPVWQDLQPRVGQSRRVQPNTFRLLLHVCLDSVSLQLRRRHRTKGEEGLCEGELKGDEDML